MRFGNHPRNTPSTKPRLLAILGHSKALSGKRRLLFEQLSQRQVLANVAGVVFEDTNLSWRPDTSEPRLQSRIVFVDSNNNSQLDDSEPVRSTDALGQFEFADLSGDEAIIRLFQGSASPLLPQFPVVPNFDAGVIAITGGTSIASLKNDIAITVAGSNVLRSNISTGSTASFAIPGPVRATELLPDGQILALASDNQSHHSFIIDSSGVVAPLSLQTPSPASGWADIAIDGSGNGLLVEQSSNATFLRSVSIGTSIVVASSTVSVGAGTHVIGGGAVTTVVSTPTNDGLLLRLWSNATATEIGSGGVEILAGQEVISYDDASGLVLLRTTADTVKLLDASAGFASLQTITGVTGPVAIDASREILYSMSTADATLRIIDLNTANVLGQFAIQTPSSSSATNLAVDSVSGKLLLQTSAGIAPISLERTDAHIIKTAVGSANFPVLFALPSNAAVNTAPKFDELPQFIMPEDTVLVVPAPKLFDKVSDAENDSFIVLLDTQAAHGVVTIKPNGGLNYVPNKDFNGIDTFKVILDDGKKASDPIELSITVTPVDDPLGINITPNEIPELLPPNLIAAQIKVINGGGQITWDIDDPRFIVDGEMLIIAPGGVFDYETEPSVTVNFTATDVASGSKASKTVVFTIANRDDPIVDIKPNTARIDENRPGDLIAELTVTDLGQGQEYTFAVDDNRFEVDSRDLRLKPGVALDYEAEQSVTVNITATSAGGVTKTEPIVITVNDIGEQAASVDLSHRQVKELVRGAVVGDVIVDGNLLTPGYIATVDDARFEIVGHVLKLRNSEFVRLADQLDVQVRITIQDASANFLPITGTFVVEVLENPNPFHNPNNIYDVDDDGQVTPHDALLIINSIARNGSGPISLFPSPDRYYDVNGDGRITALDALLVINRIQRLKRLSGEGEPAPASNNFAPIAGNSLAPSLVPLAVPTPQIASSLPTSEKVAEETISLGEDSPPAFSTTSDANAVENNLHELRDIVIEMLASDTASDAAEVDSAINSDLF